MRISDWSSDVCSSDLIHPSDHSRDDDRDACPGPRHRRARFSGNRLLRHTLVVHYRPPARGDQARARGFRAGISAVNDADFRAGIRRGPQEAIEIVEWEERKWKQGARPAANVAATREGRAPRGPTHTATTINRFPPLTRQNPPHHTAG